MAALQEVGTVAAHLPNCPKCGSRMLEGPRPFMRIFGDIRAFECSACGYILILKYPFKPALADQVITLKPAEEQACPSSLPTSEEKSCEQYANESSGAYQSPCANFFAGEAAIDVSTMSNYGSRYHRSDENYNGSPDPKGDHRVHPK
jgi:hypothetical protein